MERSWAMDVFAAVSPDEAHEIQSLITLNVVSCLAWGKMAERTADADVRWLCAGLAQWRDECANELQELLCEAGESGGCSLAPPRTPGGIRSSEMLEGAALARALADVLEQDAGVERKYRELLGNVSATFDGVITRQWKRCRELSKAGADSWPARRGRGQCVKATRE